MKERVPEVIKMKPVVVYISSGGFFVVILFEPFQGCRKLKRNRTLLFDKFQDLFGSEFCLVYAVADADPSIGASRKEEAGEFR
jgi:hypothetical protein